MGDQMNKFHIKNILLGMGIGVVLTSLTGIIYSAGMEPEMSREEIVARARQYGMVSSSEMIKKDEPEDTKPVEIEKNKVSITVDQGDSSEIVAKELFEKGLIDNVDSFLNELDSMNLQSSIQVGEYTIEEGTDNSTIARIICKMGIQ